MSTRPAAANLPPVTDDILTRIPVTDRELAHAVDVNGAAIDPTVPTLTAGAIIPIPLEIPVVTDVPLPETDPIAAPAPAAPPIDKAPKVVKTRSTSTPKKDKAPSASERSDRSDEEEGELIIAMIDDSDGLRQRARDLADARLAGETQKGGGFRGFVRRIWKGSVANEYYRQKYNAQSREELHDQDSIFGSNTRASRLQNTHTVNRFISEFEADTVHTDAGERKAVLDDSAEGQQIKQAVKDLIQSYASGSMDDEGFAAERVRVLDELSAGNRALMGQGLLYADNLLEIAQQVKNRVEAGASMEATLERMKFVVGEARTGVRTEAHLNRADRIIQRLQDTKYGSRINETTLGAGIAAAVVVTRNLTQRSLKIATAIPGISGLTTGLFAGMRESKRLKQERAQHGREMAQGGQLENNSSRRERMEQFRVTTVSASELGRNIETLLDANASIDSEEQANALLHAVGEASNRKRLSNQQRIDYMHYADVTSVEGERTYVDMMLGRAKKLLREYTTNHPDSAIAQNGGLDAVLDDMLTAFRSTQDRDNAVLDADFNSFRRKTALKSALVGAAVGAAMGFTIQETIAHLPTNFGAHHAGIAETPRSGDHKTLLGAYGLAHNAKLTGNVVPGSRGGAIVDHTINEKLGINIPKGWHIKQDGSHLQILDTDGKSVHNLTIDKDGALTAKSLAELKGSGDKLTHLAGQNPNGTPVELTPGGKGQMILPKDYTLKNVDPTHAIITDPSGKNINVEYNPDGSLTTASLDHLKAAGFNMSSQSVTVAGPMVAQQTNGNGLVFANGNQTRFVHRTDWYDNKTPNVFDKNELKAWAGGEKGTWFDKDGNVVIDVTHMTPGGSYNNWHSVDPFKANAAGNLHLGVSVTRESQAHVFDFKFQTQPDGRVIAVIPKDSPVHQLFQMDGKGGRVYNGKYFEVLQDTGKSSPNGATNVRPLATYVGHERGPFIANVPTTEQHIVTSMSRGPQDVIEILGRKEGPQGIPIDTFPIIPLRSRAGLERLTQREEYYTNAGYYSSESLTRLKRQISPRLRENPDAKLNPAEELAWYRNQLKRKRGREYLATVDRAIADSPELAQLPASTRMMVVIPVRGSTETDNIGDVLSLYAQQGAAALAETTILLNVNYTDAEVADPAEMAKVDATLAEIDAARARFPDLKIAVIKQELKTAEITGKGKGAIGYVARHTYDTAMMAVEQAIRNGVLSPEQEVMLLRKDADELGMSATFLQSYLDAAEKQQDTDVFSSNFRLQTDLHRKFPGMAVAHRFETSLEFANMRVAESRGEPSHLKTRGVAIGVRMSALAAVGSIGFSSYTSAGSDDLSVGKRIFGARTHIVEPSRYGYSRRRGGFYSDGGSVSGVRVNRDVIRRIPQAELDTHAGRIVTRYEKGLSMVGAWSDFSNGGGYKPRDATVSGSSPAIEFDDVVNDPVGVANRVAMQISASASLPQNDPRAISLALHRLFARNRNKNGDRIYNLSFEGSECRVEFTDAGVAWLQDYMLRDLRGRYDTLGDRTRRKLYNEASGTKLPRRAEPLMVQRI